MEEQNRNKETAPGEARRPSSVEEAEAAIEAVLFAMGDSVELGRIAKAIGHDTETTRRILNHMMEKYNTKDRGIHIVELENAYQMAARLCSARPKNSCGTSASIPPTICRRSVRSRWRTSAQKWKRKCRSSWMSDPAGEKRREIPICLLRTHTTGSEEKSMNSFRQI